MTGRRARLRRSGHVGSRPTGQSCRLPERSVGLCPGARACGPRDAGTGPRRPRVLGPSAREDRASTTHARVGVTDRWSAYSLVARSSAAPAGSHRTVVAGPAVTPTPSACGGRVSGPDGTAGDEGVGLSRSVPGFRRQTEHAAGTGAPDGPPASVPAYPRRTPASVRTYPLRTPASLSRLSAPPSGRAHGRPRPEPDLGPRDRPRCGRGPPGTVCPRT